MDIDTFVEISQCSRDEAAAWINAAGGDVTAALELFYSSGAVPQLPTQPVQPVQPAQPVGPAQRTRQRHTQKSLVEELNEYSHDLVSAPAPRVAPLPTVYALIPIWGLNWALATLGALLRMAGLASCPAPRETELQAYYDAKFLPGLRTTYNDSLEQSKKQLVYLLIYVTNNTEKKTEREMFADDIDSLENCIVWGASALTSEGLGVARALGARQLPFVALVAPSPETAQSSVIVMARLLAGAPSPGFIRDVRSAVAEHDPKLAALRLDRQRFDIDREIRAQQDSAYERSLAADRQRKAKQEEAKREALAAEQAAQQEEQAKEKQSEEFARSVRARAAEVAKQITGSSGNARISVRLPDGTRNAFAIDGACTVRDVYCIVFDKLIPQCNEPEFGFSLASAVRRQTLEPNETPVRDEPALWPSGVLMVDMDQ